MIYFVKRRDGAIKIGYSGSFDRRLKSLEREHGSLEVLTVREGTTRHEKALHARHKVDRIEGEWFRPTNEVIASTASDLPEITVSKKRLTLAVSDAVHSELVILAKEDGRALVRYLERQLQAIAIKGRKKAVAS